MRPGSAIRPGGSADVDHRVINRIADGADVILGSACRGAGQGAPMEPMRKYAAAKMRYATESARRKPSRSAAAPPKIARNHTMPPKMPVRVPVCSVEKF